MVWIKDGFCYCIFVKVNVRHIFVLPDSELFKYICFANLTGPVKY